MADSKILIPEGGPVPYPGGGDAGQMGPAGFPTQSASRFCLIPFLHRCPCSKPGCAKMSL